MRHTEDFLYVNYPKFKYLVCLLLELRVTRNSFFLFYLCLQGKFHIQTLILNHYNFFEEIHTCCNRFNDEKKILFILLFLLNRHTAHETKKYEIYIQLTSLKNIVFLDNRLLPHMSWSMHSTHSMDPILALLSSACLLPVD